MPAMRKYPFFIFILLLYVIDLIMNCEGDGRVHKAVIFQQGKRLVPHVERDS